MDRVLCCSPSSSSSSLSLYRPPHQCVSSRRGSGSARRRLSVLAQQNGAPGESSGSSADGASASIASPPFNNDLLLSSAINAPPVSLINYANIQKAFNAEAILTPDHYATLGLTPVATYDEVETAFKQKREFVLRQGLNEEEIKNKLRILKISYDILSSEEERRLYDWSLFHGQSPGGVYRWPYEADITQSTYEVVPPEEPIDDEGVRKFGYFFLGWFVLSCVLSILMR